VCLWCARRALLVQVDPKVNKGLLAQLRSELRSQPAAQPNELFDAIITATTQLQQWQQKLHIETPVLCVPFHHSRSSAVRALPAFDAPLRTICYFGSVLDPAMVKAVRAWATTHNAMFKVQAPICGICSLLSSATH